MGIRVADQLVEMLVQAGVKRVYAITGDSLNPVNDAIRKNKHIEWVHVRHEESAAYAASMDAELNGIGCCMGSSGPGHVHMVNGLYDANRAGNRVIAIASTCASHKFGQEYFQGTNPYYLFHDCAKYVEVASTPAQFAHMMQAALQACISENGVAVVGLPGDVAAAEAAHIPSSLISFNTSPIYRPSEQEMVALADLVNSSEKITLYCGHGAKDARQEVYELARALQAPMAFTFRGKIFFDSEDNEFCAGLNGLLGYRSGYDACHKCDLLLMLGSDFPYDEFMPKDNKIVQIDNDPRKLGRRARVHMGLAGNLADTIKDLIPRLQKREKSEFLEQIQKDYQKTQKEFSAFISHKGEVDEIQPEYVAHLIDEIAADDAIITVDTGMTSVWAARFIRRKKNRYLTGSFNHGSMANAMPMSIGAAMGGHGRQAVALCGDGGISMLLGDMATIAQYKLPVKMIVFNNRALGMVKLEMEVAGLVDWQTNMVNPEFDKVAEAMGISAFVAHKSDEVEKAIREAFEHDGPALVNIYTNADALSLPPHPDLAQMRGFLVSMAKKVFAGDGADVVNTIKANMGHAKEVL